MPNHISMSCQICPRGCFLEATEETDGDWVIKRRTETGSLSETIVKEDPFS